MSARCNYRQINREKPGPRCLILVPDERIGHEVENMLQGAGWEVDVVYSDSKAYEHIRQGDVDIVITDIDTVDLGGLAVLVYCHHHYISITTYAISPAEDSHRKKLARDIGGCQGFIYLEQGSPKINTSRGMAMKLTERMPWQASMRAPESGHRHKAGS